MVGRFESDEPEATRRLGRPVDSLLGEFDTPRGIICMCNGSRKEVSQCLANQLCILKEFDEGGQLADLAKFTTTRTQPFMADRIQAEAKACRACAIGGLAKDVFIATCRRTA